MPRSRGALALLVLSAACARSQPAREELAPVARPTLEEIFLEPPVSGTPPTVHSVSDDGRYLLLRWRPPEAQEERDEQERRPPLRLLDVEARSDGGREGIAGPKGTPVTELLPDGEGEDDFLREARWSPRGHVLALGRGRDLFLLDPATMRLERAVTPPPLSDGADGADGADAGGTDEEEGGREEPRPREGGEQTEAGAADRSLKRIVSIRFTPDGRELRFSDRDELYSIPLEADGFPSHEYTLDEARWWSEAIDANSMELSWSADLRVVFGHDPRPLLDVEVGVESEVGEDSEPEVEPGPQVVWIEEGRSVVLEGMAELGDDLSDARLSPDGRYVIGWHVDRSNEPSPTLVPNYLTERVTTERSRRKLADDGPSPTRVFAWRTTAGERMEIGPFAPLPGSAAPAEPEAVAPDPPDDEASGREPGEETASREEASAEPPDPATLYWQRAVGWAPRADASPSGPAPARYAFERRSADFRELEIWCWSEEEVTRLWLERDEAWIGGPARRTRWYHDGSLLLVGSESAPRSTTPGRCQVFALDPVTGESWQLTEVAGEMKTFSSPAGGGLAFEFSSEDPAGRRIAFLDDADVRSRELRAPRLAGSGPYDGGATWSRGGEEVVYEKHALLVPSEIWRARPGREPAPLTQTRPPAFDDIDWIRPVRLQVQAPPPRRPDESTDAPARGPRSVWAQVYLPYGLRLDRRPARPRATIVFVHGAGYLQNVTHSMTRYPLNAMFHSRLARMGYIVVDVDYRGSAGYGRDFRTDVQYHLGGEVLEDIHRVVDELVERGLVDGERLGIYGGSYGGFMALMALFTAPDRWSAGAALRSVTDWRTYSPSYTQPRLGRPSTHPEAYERSSPIDHLTKLEDPLLVLHGMRDRNVFAQDSIRLIEGLIDHGLDFDAMLYPSQGHGFTDGPHWLDEYRRIESFLTRHLGPP